MRGKIISAAGAYRHILLPASLLLIALSIYMPALYYPFLMWDDGVYVTNNQLLQNGDLKALFFSYYDGHYHPLTLLSLKADFLIAGLHPAWYHGMNLLLHMLCVYLVFRLIRRLLKDDAAAWFAALIFAVHPLQTEAVVWISARKDLLYAFFFFIALHCYVAYREERKTSRFVLSWLFFLLSVLCKEQAVMLSPLLFVVDYFLKKDFRKVSLYLEKIPFFIASAFFGMLSIYAQRETGYIRPFEGDTVDFAARLVLGSYGLLFYLIRLIAPLSLSAYYPYPFDVEQPVPAQMFLFPIVLFLGIVLIFFFRKKIPREVITSLLIFVIPLLVMLRFFHANPGDIVVADRYTYVPVFGAALLAGFLYLRFRKWQKLKVFFVAILVLSGFFIAKTIIRSRVWSDSLVLVNDILSKHPDVYTALNCRGSIYLEEHKFDNALADFNRALQINPHNDRAYANRGLLFAKTGRHDAAVADFNVALELDPLNQAALLNRARIFALSGETEKAKRDFSTLIRMNPFLAAAYSGRGMQLSATGSYEEALRDFDKALQLDAGDVQARSGKAYVYYYTGRFEASVREFSSALKYAEQKSPVFFGRGLAEYQMKNFDAAAADFTSALDENPGLTEAYLYRGFAFYNQRKFAAAVSDLSLAIAGMPENALAYAMRGLSYKEMGDVQSACNDLRTAASLGNPAAEEEYLKICGR
jgi:protein O-mannosyl-transferase